LRLRTAVDADAHQPSALLPAGQLAPSMPLDRYSVII